MADETGIINGSFKGVPISIESSSVDGGRKIAVKQFPNRNTQNVEDLGLRPRRYSLEIIVSAKTTQDYFSYRNSLLAVLESGGAGELIHPLYGRIENIVAVSYSLSENFTSFGNTVVSVEFEVKNNTGIPQSAGNSVTNVQSLNNAVVAAVQADIAENFAVSPGFTGNFEAAVNKVNGIIEKATQAVSFVGATAQIPNEFNALLERLAGSTNSLVSTPAALALATIELFDNVNALYDSAEATFATFTDFFGFGSDDQQYQPTTAGLIQRQANSTKLNGAVAASALGYAYVAGVRLPFETTRDIDETAAALDAQYQAVQTSDASQDVKDAITEMRVTVVAVLNLARLNASQIITVETLPTSTRLLGFSYYGNDELGQTITDLNRIDDVNFVEGEIEILTA